MMCIYLSCMFLSKIICLFEKLVKAMNMVKQCGVYVANIYFFYRLGFIKMFNGKLFQVAMQVSLQLHSYIGN